MSVRPYPPDKEGNERYVIDFYPSGRKGKRIRQIFKGTKGEALEFEMAARRAPGEATMLVAPIIKDLIDDWLRYYKTQVASRTYDRTVGGMAHWLPIFGNFKPANITIKLINNYKQQRLKDIANKAAVERGKPPRYIKKSTINKELSALSSFLKWAEENDFCPPLTVKIKGFPRKQILTKAPKILTPRQVTKMYEAIDDQYKLIFLLMADMGLRPTEATTAKVEDVDEFRETIAVAGKGNKERILPWTTERFKKIILETLDKRVDGYLTINPITKKNYTDLRKPLRRAANAIDLNKKVNPHLLRHTCLTNLAEQGMSPHALQAFAGHSSIETTNKIYTHIRQDYVGDEVKRIRATGFLEK